MSSTTPASGMLRGARLWRVAAVALVSAVVLVAGTAHTPYVRARALGWMVSWLRQSGITAEIARLDYNLLALTISIEDVTLAAEGADTPFFSADALHLDLPWSVLRGAWAVQSLEIDRPVVAIVRRADGSLNLPEVPGAESDGTGGSIGPVRIDRLVIRRLEARHADESVPLFVDAREVTLDMRERTGDRLAGRLSSSGGVTVRSGDRETILSTLDGGLAFDGVTLFVEALTLDAAEGRVRLDGTVGLLAPDQRIDLRYEGRVDVERAAAWVTPASGLAGGVLFSGRVQGPLDRLDAGVDVRSEGLTVGPLGEVVIDGRAALSGTTVTVDSLRAAVAGGEISADARVQLEEAGSSAANVRFRALDIGTLASLGSGVPLAGAVTGAATFEWTGRDPATGQGRLTARTSLPTARPRRAGVTLAGTIDVGLADGAWSGSIDQRVAGAIDFRGRAGGRFVRDDLSTSTISGRAAVEVDSLREAIASLGTAGLGVDPELAAGMHGTAVANLDLGGTFAAPLASGTLSARELVVAGVGPGTVDATLAASADRVAIEALSIRVASNEVSGSGAIGLAGRTVSGSVTAWLPELEALARPLPAEWRPVGSARLDAQLGGTIANPAVSLTLSSDGFRVAGQTVRSVHGRLALADRTVTVDELELVQDPGRLQATGRYDLEAGRYAFSAAGSDITIAPLSGSAGDATGDAPAAASPVPVEARFDLRLDGSGTVADPRAQGVLEFSRLDWDRYRLGTARADVTVEQGSARLVAAIPSVSATLDVRTALDAPHAFSFEAAVVDARISDLVRIAEDPAAGATTGALGPDDIAGAVTVRAAGSGRLDAPTDAAVDLEVSLLDVAVLGAPVRLDRPAHVRYAERAFVADDVDLRVGGSRVWARGRLGLPAGPGDALALDLTGSLADFTPFLRLAAPAHTVDVSGAIDVRARATGALDAPDVTADFSIDAASVAIDALPPVRDVALRGTYTGGLLDVTALRGEWQGGTVTASARVPAIVLGDVLPEAYRRTLPDQAPTARVTASISAITPAVIAPFVAAETLDQIAGRVDAVVELEADGLELEAVRGDLTLSRAEFELARVPLRQTQPTRLRLDDGRLRVVAWDWAGAGNLLAVAGEVDLRGQVPQLLVHATSGLDVRMLGAFVPDVATEGRASLDLYATGPADAPHIEGQVTLADGGLAVREPRVAVTDVTGTLTLVNDRVVVRGLTGNVNGGTLTVDGEVGVSGFTPGEGSLRIAGRGLAMAVPEDLRTEVDADLELALSPASPQLTGRVTILRGAYRAPISLAGRLLTGVQEVTVEPISAEPGFVDRIQLGIAVVSEEDILVDNNYGRLNLGLNLRAIGTVGQPALAGRVTFREGGEVYLGGQTYEVVRGTADFTNPLRIEPDIDLALETRVQRYDITLEVRGTPDALEASLRSPGLSQQDVVSLLLTGSLADQTMVQTEIARGQLVMLLSGELLGFAGRAVGFDSVQLGRGLGGAASNFDLLTTTANPATRLTITKDLRRDVEVVFSQSLRESGAITWIAIYRPLRGLELRGTTEDDGRRAYEFRHQLDFGGGVAPRAGRAGQGQGASVRVADVRFTGRPGFAEPELRRRIRLDDGDRFDVHRWQEDQDRLAAFYHERGFFEARIAARRHAGQDGAVVSLEYAIERGPATRLRIDGFTFPSSVVDRMKVAWSGAVFDGFLLQDLEALARRALVEQNHPRAAVETAVTSQPEDDDTKEITLFVAPNERFAERRLAFAGNARVPTEALEALVRARQLDVTAWIDPRGLEEAVEQHYRSIGSLAAEVTVAPPVYDGPIATLPVRVVEGPPFRIAGVSLQGARREREPAADVLRAAGLGGDAPYDPSMLEPARRAVEEHYYRQGYNDAHVTLTTRVDPDRSAVDIVVDVAEGQQQILAGVDVRGAEATSSGTIERAVNLEAGQPANLAEVYRAQKRLYDTGVFQSADVTIDPVDGEPAGDETASAVRASVVLQELPRYRFRYGMRLNDEAAPAEVGRQTRPALVVDLLRRNLFGRAVSTGVAGQLEADRRLGRGFLSLPQLFGLPATTNLFLTSSREDFTPEGSVFVEDKLELAAEQRFRPARSMLVTYGYSAARTHVFELNPVPGVPVLDVVLNVARLTGTYAWETRDDPSNARRGWFHSSGLEYGPGRLGSDFRFVRYLAQQYFFRTFGRDVVLASGVRVGAGRGFGQDLIPSEKFFAGGGTTVRGFAEDGLGGRDFLGDTVGGNALLLFNQELRFPLFRWIRGVGFVDAGNVFPRARDLSLSGLEAGTGVGLRIDSPFALLRIDFGIPLTRRRDEPGGRWYFGIGHAF